MNSSKNKERQYLQVCFVNQTQDQDMLNTHSAAGNRRELGSHLPVVRASLVDEGLLQLGRQRALHRHVLPLQVVAPVHLHHHHVQIGLQQPCIGPLPSLKPARQPKGQPHPNVSQVRVEVLWAKVWPNGPMVKCLPDDFPNEQTPFSAL